MSRATSVAEAVTGRNAVHSPILFQSLILTEPESHQGRKSATFFISLFLHSLLVVAVLILPLLYYDALPSQEALKAFFVQPLEVAPPPPPPSPPSASRAVARPSPKVQVQQPSGFVAPIDVPSEIKPEEPAGAWLALPLAAAPFAAALLVGFWCAPITAVLNVFLKRTPQLQLAFGLLLAVALVAR